MIFHDFKTRSLETERLDRGEFTRAEYLRWQKEMWFIHRALGEKRALKKALSRELRYSRDRQVSVLDVAAGSGSLLAYVRGRRREGDVQAIGLEVTEESARTITRLGALGVCGNAFALPFGDASIDVVFSTLFLHHLSEDDAVTVLREMSRVAKRKVIVVDLDRRAIPYFAYKFLGGLLLQRFTRDDGALSIKRAYRAHELRRLAQRSGLTNFRITRSAVNRLILTSEVAGNAASV